MIKGFACHARGVEILQTGRAHVRARVRSKRTYEVDLRAEGGRLLIACSCPARSMGIAACKHAWAALLEVDRQGGLEDLRGTRGILRVEPAPEQAPSEAEPSRETAPPLEATTPEPVRRERATEEKSASKRSEKRTPARPGKTEAKPGPARAKPRDGGRPRGRSRS